MPKPWKGLSQADKIESLRKDIEEVFGALDFLTRKLNFTIQRVAKLEQAAGMSQKPARK